MNICVSAESYSKMSRCITFMLTYTSFDNKTCGTQVVYCKIYKWYPIGILTCPLSTHHLRLKCRRRHTITVTNFLIPLFDTITQTNWNKTQYRNRWGSNHISRYFFVGKFVDSDDWKMKGRYFKRVGKPILIVRSNYVVNTLPYQIRFKTNYWLLY